MSSNDTTIRTNNPHFVTESIVNRWLVDYYAFLAIQSFKDDRYSDFCEIREVLNDILSRPLECTSGITTKLQVLQFLTRIIDGDKLSLRFDIDAISPLESAMLALVNIAKECNVPQQDVENLHTSIKEMLVIICIKTMEFEKAKEMLNKHFPKGMVGKKAIFMALINQKCKTHEVLEQVTFENFKREMVQFCENLLPSSPPFLHKAAQKLQEKRALDEGDNTDELITDEQHSPAHSPDGFMETLQFGLCSSTSDHTVIQRRRLEAAYAALARDSSPTTLVQLLEEVEKEELNKTSKGSVPPHPSNNPLHGTDMEHNLDIHVQRDSCSPVEFCNTDQKILELRNVRQYTVAQLVVEPDSLTSSQCSTSQEQETTIRPVKLLALNSEATPLGPVKANECSKSRFKHHRQASKAPNKTSIGLMQSSEEDVDDPVCSDNPCRTTLQKLCKSHGSNPHRKNSTKLKPLSDDSDEDTHGSLDIRAPVQRHRKRQASSSLGKNSPGSERLPADSEEDSADLRRTPAQAQHSQQSSCPEDVMNPTDSEDMLQIDSSLDSSPERCPYPFFQKSSTPLKSHRIDSRKKWKQLFKDAKEANDTWSDEESLFGIGLRNGAIKRPGDTSSSMPKRKVWTAEESKMLKDAVARFGEGNWSKIRSHFPFKGRTNINLKDRWRTMKNQHMV